MNHTLKTWHTLYVNCSVIKLISKKKARCAFSPVFEDLLM
jgi:hypothetical protein